MRKSTFLTSFNKKGLSMYVTNQHALKGQKLLAQGNALGYYVRKLVAL